jgi:hypothetical protein
MRKDAFAGRVPTRQFRMAKPGASESEIVI